MVLDQCVVVATLRTSVMNAHTVQVVFHLREVSVHRIEVGLLLFNLFAELLDLQLRVLLHFFDFRQQLCELLRVGSRGSLVLREQSRHIRHVRALQIGRRWRLLTLVAEEVEHLVQRGRDLDVGPVVVRVPRQALLEEHDLVSEDLHSFSQFFHLLPVLEHEPVRVDFPLDWEFVVRLDHSSILELESTQLEGKHFRQLLDPFCLDRVTLCCFVDFVALDLVEEGGFPRSIEILLVSDLEQHVVECLRSRSLLMVVLLV